MASCGGGAPAANFTTLGDIFIVEACSAAANTVTANTTFGTGVTLQIANGATLTVNSGVTLRTDVLDMLGAGTQLNLLAGGQIDAVTISGTGQVYASNTGLVTLRGTSLNAANFASAWIHTLTLANPANLTLTGSITAGNGGLTLNNTGNFIVAAANQLTIQDGTISATGSGRIDATAGVVVSGVGAIGSVINGNAFLNNTIQQLTVNYACTINNTVIITSGCSVAGGNLTINGGANILRMTNGSTLSVNGTRTLFVNGLATLEIQDNPTVTVSGAITYGASTAKLLYTGTVLRTAGPELPTPTMLGQVIVNKTGANVLQISLTTSINGGLTVQSGYCDILTASGNVTLGAASQVQNGAYLRMLANSTLSGGANLTVQAGGTLALSGGPITWTGTPTYSATGARGTLLYDLITRTTAAELPTVMDGNVLLNGAGTSITLGGAAVTINGSLTLNATPNNPAMIVPSPRVLTLANAVNTIGNSASLTAQSPNGEVIITGSLANSGTVSVVGLLSMSGAGTFTGINPTISGTLRYIGTNPSYTTGAEFPSSPANLGGSLVLNRAAGDILILQNGKIISGNCTVTQGILQTSAVGASLGHTIIGNVTVAANGLLRVQENSTVGVGGTTSYSAASATLEYAGTILKTPTGAELPSPFGGSIIVNNSGGVQAPAALVDMNVAGASFTMSLGNWKIPAGGTLQLRAGVGYLSGGAASYIETTPAANGNNAAIIRNLGVAANWHLGSGGVYRLVATGAPSAATDIRLGYANVSPTGTSDNAPFVGSATSPAYWYASTSPAANMTMTLNHPSITATTKVGSYSGATAAGAYSNVPVASIAGSSNITPAIAFSPTVSHFALGTGPVNTSDIVAATPAYVYTAPIDIATFNAAANLGSNVTATSVSLFEFDVRDNGGDTFATTMTDLNITLNDVGSNLRKIALYDGATELTEITAVNGVLVFTGFMLNIPNNTTKRLSLRATFNLNVTDNSSIGFTINSATANVSGSGFTGFAPLLSSTVGNNNRISVVATMLAFPNAIGNQVVNTTFSPAVDVRAVDVNNNLDLDVAGTMTLTGAPIPLSAGASSTLVAGVGVGTFSSLQMAGVGAGNTLTATLGALTGVSASFSVTTTPVYWGCTIPSTPPPAPVLGIGGRNMNFSNVGIALAPAAPVIGVNSLTNVAPNTPINLSFDWNMSWPGGVYCPGCVVQMYVGIGGGSGFAGNGSSATGFTQCVGTGVYNGSSGSQPSFTFNAPSKPGIYYITQNWTLHYYCNPHPVTFNNDQTYALAVIQVVDPIPPSGGCNEADIIPTPGFTYQTNIPYDTYTGAMSATHPAVWSFRIRDFGTIPTQGDIDNKPTQVVSIGLNVTDAGGVLQEIALYNGTGLIETQPVSGSGVVTFSSPAVASNLIAPDDGFFDITVRARFRTSAITPPMDNRQFSFTINAANVTMAAPAVSTQKNVIPFAASGPSSTAGNNNRVEVTATRYGFQVSPPSPVNAAVIIAPTVTTRAEDINSNIDLDYTGNVTLTTAPTNYVIAGGGPITSVAGLATFPALSLSGAIAPLLNQQLTASGGLTSGLSTPFDINPSTFHQMMTGVNANVLGNWQLNGVGANPTALGVPGATYIIGATPGANPSAVTASAALAIQPNSAFTVNNGSVLVVANGVGVTNDGALTINGGGTLRLVGTGVVLGGSMNNVAYTATTATLEYAGPVALPRITTSREFPAAFAGRLLMNRPVGAGTDLSFDNSKTIAGEFQQIGGGDILLDGTNVLTLNGGATIAAGGFSITNTAQLITNNSFVRSSAGLFQGAINAVFTANGAFTNTAGNLVWNSASNVALNGTTTWDVGTLNLSGTGNLSVGAAGSFTLNGGSVTLSNTGTFTCNGTFANPSGNFAVGSSALVLNGAANFGGGGFNSALNAGVIRILGTGTLTGTFNNVSAGYATFEINRAGQTLVLAPGNLITTNLQLTDGIIQTANATSYISVGSTLTHSGSATTYIDGRVQWQLFTGTQINQGPFIFPLGKAGRYLPFQLMNVDGTNPVVEAEAFSASAVALGAMAGPGFANLSSTEYWSANLQSGALTATRVQLSRATPTLTAAVVGWLSGASPAGSFTGLGGGVSGVNVASVTPLTGLATPPNNTYLMIGSLPSSFYYFSGPAENLTSWNSQLNGLGAPALSFTTPVGQTFIVPNGRTAPFGTNTTFGAGITLQVEGGGIAQVAPSAKLNVQGVFFVNANGRVRLIDTAGVIAPSGIFYLDPTSTLEYDSPNNRLTNDIEFPSLPSLMQGSIVVRNGSIRLNGSKSVQGGFALDTAMMSFGTNFLNANILTVHGALRGTGTASILADSSNRLSILGAGNISGAFSLTGKLGSLTMNRAAQTLNFANSVAISTTLTLTAGNISMTAANTLLSVQNPAQNAIVGGGVSSYVVGTLSRSLAPNLVPSVAPALPTVYVYPIGTPNRFLGASLVNATTGSAGADVAVEGVSSAAGGTIAPGVTGALSTGEYWRVQAISGEYLGSSISVFRTSPAFNTQHRIGTSILRSGAYSSANGGLFGSVFGPSLQSDPVQHGGLPFAAANSERFYAVLGILPNAPRIFGFSPSAGGTGTVIRVTGANFSTVNAAAIGGIPLSSFSVFGDSTIVGTVANGVSGAVQVTGTAGGAASDSIFRFIPPPQVGTISPSPAGYGLPITITGTNLGGQNTTVNIGGVNIPITPANVLSDGSLQIIVPPNASNGTIIISTPGGYYESTSALVLVERPVITSVSPQIAATGETVTLFGQNFSNARFVRFGGGLSLVNLTNANFTVNSPNRVTVRVPAQTRRPIGTTGTFALAKEINGATLNADESVPITIETPGGQATTGTLAANTFYYRTTPIGTGGGTGGGGPEQLPQVSVVRFLDQRVAVGGRVRVTGANMDVVAGIRLTSTIASTLASWQVNSTAQLTIITPPTGLLTTTTQSISSSLITAEFIGAYNQVIVTNAFTVVANPRVLSVQPTDGEAGDSIVVSGTNLNLVTGVLIGGQTAQYSTNASGQLVIRIPIATNTTGSTSPTAGTLVLQGEGGSIVNTGNVINQQYLTSQPIITRFSPTLGAGNTVVVVTGANFTGINDILVVGIPVANFVINSPSRLTLIVSTQASVQASGPISLVTNEGTYHSRQNFTLTQSLESDIAAISRETGLALDQIRSRLRTEGNTIIGVDLSDIRLPNGSFPDFLRNLKSLRYLNLSNAGLIGPIPAWVGTLVNLEEIDISKNELSGPLYDAVTCPYPNLRLLNASFNRLEGSIPACITTRERVQVLRLNNNKFTGTIPLDLGTMPNLRILTLNENSLEGSIPSTFGATRKTSAKQVAITHDAQSIEVLDVSNNKLSGTLPRDLGNAQSLKTLNVSNNRFTGAIPQELGNIPTLENVNFSHNRFTGEFPATFTNAKRLRVLRVNANTLTSFPEIALTGRIDTLEMQENRFDFASIEPYMDLRSATSQRQGVRFVYSPQDSIGTASTQELRVGESVTLSVRAGGKANEYQWFKNGVALSQNNIPSASTANLRLSGIQARDAASYTCRITNALVQGLTLLSRPQNITITTAGLTLAAPEPIYPSQGAENIGVQTRLVWTRVRGVDGYEVQWAEDANLRTNIDRRYITQASSDTTLNVETRISGLGRGVKIYWRVRAIAGQAQISKGEALASSQWTDVREFTVVPLGTDLAIGTIDAGKASIGDESTGQSVATNVGNDAIQIDNISVDAADASRFRLKTTIQQGQSIMLASGDEFPVEIAFTPKQTGLTTGTLRVRYRDGQGTARELTFRAVARGSGSSLSIEPINFDTVRVGRTTFRSALITNRTTEPVRVTGASVVTERGTFEAVFATRNAPTIAEPLVIAPQDTVPILLTARATEIGIQRATLQLFVASDEANGRPWNERAEASIRAVARNVLASDVAIRVGVRPSLDSVAPGGVVRLEVYLLDSTRGKMDTVRATAQPTFRGTLNFNRQVLTLTKGRENGARVISDPSGKNDLQRIRIPQTSWDGRSAVLFSFDATAIAGETDFTALEIEDFVWGSGSGAEQRQSWESQVYVDDLLGSTFVAQACKAGGKRLVTSAKAGALAVSRPNPVKDIANINFTLREDGQMALELVSMSGKVVNVILEGDYTAGEYDVQMNCSTIPSGTYLLRLTTNTGVITRTMTVVR